MEWLGDISEKSVSYDEQSILRQIAEGDEKAFAVLVSHYWNNMYAQALTYIKSTHAAQDIVQEVFIKVWEKRKTLVHVERFDSFLFIMARNHIISELRKKIMKPISDDFEDVFKEESALPDKMLSLKHSNELLSKAIDRLPGQQKTAFLLSRDEGLTYEEIAAKMNLSKETVKKHICKALNFLRTYLRTHYEIAFYFFVMVQWYCFRE